MTERSYTPPPITEDELLAEVEAYYPERAMAVLELEGKLMETSEWAASEERRRSENVRRSMRRSRTMSNEFRYFVTLTLDRQKVDRYDIKAVVKKLRTWADNAVRRHGLKYILVPELHKDGAVHFHGFFNDALPAVDSGTLSNGGKPRRPRSDRDRERLLSEGWHVVYNLPSWTLGFTTAIELYGRKQQAVNYCLKYISKAAETTGRIGGRWYYSGGELARPRVDYVNMSMEDARVQDKAYSFVLDTLGAEICIFEMEADT